MNFEAIIPEALERSQDFQDGVVAGYHDCAIDLATTGTPENDAELQAIVDQDRQNHSQEWYAGWFAGYKVRMDKAHGRSGKR